MHPANQPIVASLRDAASLLQAQKAGAARVRPVRAAASAIEGLGESVEALVAREGVAALAKLPGIGAPLASVAVEMARGVSWPLLDRLRGEHDPEALFCSVAGIGADLARRIHDALHVDTLEALEDAAHDGQLARVKGIGPRRAETIRKALATRLGRSRPASQHRRLEPPVDALLDIDRLYRERSAAGALPTIAPRRFNAERRAWLPVLHERRGDWHYTALYSNAARAHEAGVGDWVSIYFYDATGREGQRTIATEAGNGPLASRRTVRGREKECLGYYTAKSEAARPMKAGPRPISPKAV